ncbi:MAG TPA: type II toxin-antitoxin system VapC family toxin [Magnetococcales bacterium]|nr:type II toxin-antitoxin system VapC family toxin [Magnetococcales bacterium]
MRDVLVDSNVLLDVITYDPQWGGWSASVLTEVASCARIVINPIIFAEVSVGFRHPEELAQALPPDLAVREPLPYMAAFLAGKAYKVYRQKGGQKTSPLPDFFIGAHATVMGYRLLTRDPKPYRTYFPKVELIAPMDRLFPLG